MQLEPLQRCADAERPVWVPTPERGNHLNANFPEANPLHIAYLLFSKATRIGEKHVYFGQK